jgi:HEAT repeat protein
MLRITGLALAVGLLAAPASAQEPTRPQVRQLLSGYEQGPSAEQWRALGPGTLAVLVALYDDPAEPPYVRLRAVGAAAHYPGPAARTFLLAVARAPDQGDLFVREAVLALGRAFGAEALADVRPFLDSRHPVVREAAGRALGAMATPEAAAALRSRITRERDRVVRGTLLTQLELAVRAPTP